MMSRALLRTGFTLTLAAALVLLVAWAAGPADLEGMPVRPILHSETLTNATQASKVQNGDFGAAGGWTIGADWAVGAGVATKAATGVTTLSQTSANMLTPIVVGDVYLVTYQITVFGVTTGGLTPSICGRTLANVTAAAAYRDYVRCTSTAALTFTPGNALSTLTLDNVSIQFVAHAEADQVVAWEEDSGGIAGQGGMHVMDEGGAWYRMGGGQLSGPLGTLAAPTFTTDRFPGTGFLFSPTNIQASVNGVASLWLIASGLGPGTAGNAPTWQRTFGIWIDPADTYAWGNAPNVGSANRDLFLGRDGAATLQMGVDAAAPVTQLLKGSDATGGGPTAGGILRFQGGAPAGAAAYGQVQIPNSQLTLNAGTAALPAYSWTADSTTGFFSVGGGVTEYSSGGTLSLTLGADVLLFGAAQDLVLQREAATILQLGNDAAAPVAQTVKAHDGVGNNIAGANLSIAAGRSTGAGLGGDILFKTTNATAAAAVENTLIERARIHATQKTFNDVTATILITAVVPSLGGCSVVLAYGANTKDAAQSQNHAGIIYWASSATNAGAVTSVAVESTEAVSVTAGTYTDTWDTTVAANQANLRANYDSSLNTPTTLNYNIIYSNGCALTFP